MTIARKCFPANLRALLSVNAMKQADLAELMGCTQAAVSSWVAGTKMPRIDDIERLAELLEVDPAGLLGWTILPIQRRNHTT